MALEEAIVVFTAKSIDRILREGGTSAWRLNRNRARQCPLVVCTRNAHSGWVEGKEAHHSAFVVGKVLDVVPCEATPENNESDKNRYLIRFSEFARVNIPDYWEGDRNPVVYRSLEQLGIDPTALRWEVMPEPVPSVEPSDGLDRSQQVGFRPLTLSEAKKGLALTFNVAPEAVEITIRG
jgi:hypothetical protein